MEKTIKHVLELKDSTNPNRESSEIEQFIKFAKSLQIEELEPLLEETKYSEEVLTSDKYFLLSVLREMFRSFKEQGDDTLEYRTGSCQDCEHNKGKTVHIFEGTTSKDHFGFVPVKDDSPHLGFHFCYGFVDSNGKKADNYHSCLYYAAQALADIEMQKNRS